jgi:hypothetical protein
VVDLAVPHPRGARRHAAPGGKKLIEVGERAAEAALPAVLARLEAARLR